MKFKIKEFIRNINNLELDFRSPESLVNPIMSIRHSDKIQKIISDSFHTYEIYSSLFIEVIERNNKISWGRNFLKFSEISEESIDKIELVTIEAKSLFDYEKNYLVRLDNNSYCICYKTNESDKQYLNFVFIICRKNESVWQTPPVKKKNCLYICGNRIYNGYLLLSDYGIHSINGFKREYMKLSKLYNNEYFQIIPEFKIRFNWNIDYGTSYFRGNSHLNETYIIDILHSVKMNSIQIEKKACVNYTHFKNGDVDHENLLSIVKKSSAGICGWADSN